MKEQTKRKWLTIIQRQQKSGLIAAQFCRNENIGENYFSYIKKRLLKECESNTQEFAKVNITEAPMCKESMACIYKNSTLKFKILPDPKWLSQLLSSLS